MRWSSKRVSTFTAVIAVALATELLQLTQGPA